MLVVYDADAGQIVSAETFAEMIKGRGVIEQAVAHLGLSDSVEAVQARVQARARSSTQLIEVVATGKDARQRPAADTTGANDAAERYRMLRTGFALRTAEEEASTVLFAASLPCEGTSTTAANFAVALARTGRRVALVVLALRLSLPRPRLSGAKAGGGQGAQADLRPAEQMAGKAGEL